MYALLILPPLVLLHLVSGRHVVPCKERKVVVTPWHVTSTAPVASNCDWLTTAIGLLLAGFLPFLTVLLELQYIVDALLGHVLYLSFSR